jgi:RHS repeat-associated protein
MIRKTFSVDGSMKVRTLTMFALLLTILFYLSNTARGQERGFQPGGSYALSDIEAINASNGNMIMEIPLASLPPSRGGVPGPQLKLVYNSKLYETHTENIPDEATGEVITQIFLNPDDDAGWRYSTNFGYSLNLISRMNLEGQYPCVCDANYQKNAYIWKMMVMFPDGGEHEFRPFGYTDRYDDGYYDIDPHGTQNFAGCISVSGATSCNFSTSQATTSGMTYYSTDGTFMRLFVPFTNGDWSTNWTLSFPDGRRLISTPGNQTMLDRNNNIVPMGLQDTLGRQITMTHNGTTNEDHIFVTGANNQQLEWIVKWKTIYVSRPYMATTASSGRERGNTYQQVLTNEAVVVERITLPSQAGGLTYIFGYSASDTDIYPDYSTGWGELNSITLPSGARADYKWAFDGDVNNFFGRPPTWDWVLNNHPVQKDLTYLREYDGTSTPITETWTYTGVFRTSSTFSVTAPDGGVTKTYSFAAATNSPFVGYAFKTEYPDGSVTERVWKQNRPQGIPIIPKAVNPYVQREFHSIRDAAGALTKTAIKEYNYDKNGNVTRIDEYDWVDYNSLVRDSEGNLVTPANAVLKKRTTATYYNAIPDATDSTTFSGNVYYASSAPQLLNALKASEISAGEGALSRSEFFYDNPLTTGNLTQQKSWDSSRGGYSNPLTSSNSISVAMQYNSLGNPTLMTDARGVQTHLTYGPISGFADLYPTQTEMAYGSSLKRTETRQYDFNTGLVTSITDVDNNVLTITSYDDLGRPVLIRASTGLADETQTFTQYFDSERRVVVRSDLDITGDLKLATIQHYDQLGRIRLTRRLEDVSVAALADETAGIKIQRRYLIDNPCQPTNTSQCLIDNKAVLASYVLTSNPYRSATSNAAAGEPTMGWSRTKSGNGGRTIEMQTFAGSTLPAPWGGNSSSTGAVTTVYDGIFMTVMDQAGRIRRSKVDGLGRLIRVDEPSDAVNTLGSQDSPTQDSRYEYDALGNLTVVTQGTQTRSFGYSSLGRLMSASNPESGVISYEYDESGNLAKKIGPRLVPNTSTQRTITYGYDALNRVTTCTYNDGTPNVSYSYDAVNISFSKGRLTSVSSSVSAYSYGEYDPLGRVKTGTQTTDGQAYTMSYAYNKAGAITSQTYPSGRVVSTNYDAAGRIAGVKNITTGIYYAGAASTDAANRLQYAVNGAIQTMRLGNNLWEHTNFNSRLQPTQIALGTSATDSSKLKLDYAYGVLVNGVPDATKNNGNTQSQTLTLPGLVLTQSYTYDELNRLKFAQEMNASTEVWKQTFSYDRFGNRRFEAANTTLPQITPQNEASTNPTISTADNRISAAGYRYDLAGNLECDPTHPCGSNAPFPAYYEFDGENRINTANGGASSGGSTYVYDGDGRRVKKIVGGPTTVTTVFVYDIVGRLIAEYGDQQPLTSGTSYLTADHLGTPRVIAKADGSVSGRHDYQPFGEELFAGMGGRTTAQAYSASDGVRQQFTGQQRDDETGLDFFEARYFSSTQGRFTSVDPLLSSATSFDPQTWDRYSYALNNPLAFNDPSGMYTCSDSKNCSSDADKRFEQQRQAAIKKLADIEKRYGTNSKEYTDAARAVNAYGDPNKDNGVIVNFGSLAAGTQGTTSPNFPTTGNNSVTVTIDLNQNKKDGDLLLTIAHEGSHVQDNLDYQTAVIAAAATQGNTAQVEAAVTAVLNGPLRVTHGASETRAYGVSAVFAEFTLGGGTEESAITSTGTGMTIKFDLPPIMGISVGGETIWKSSWKNSEIDKIRKLRSVAITKGLAKDPRYASKLNQPIQ